jgi:hypothetical protein
MTEAITKLLDEGYSIDDIAELTREACEQFWKSPAGVAKSDQLHALCRDVADEVNLQGSR